MDTITNIIKKYGVFALITAVALDIIYFGGRAFASTFFGSVANLLTLIVEITVVGLLIFAKFAKKDKMSSILSLVLIAHYVTNICFNAFKPLTNINAVNWAFVTYIIFEILFSVGFLFVFVMYLLKVIFNIEFLSNYLKLIVLGSIATLSVAATFYFIGGIVDAQPVFAWVTIYVDLFLFLGLYGDMCDFLDKTFSKNPNTKSDNTSSEPKES